MVEIYLNGKPHYLRYDWHTFCVLERKAGLGLLNLMDEILGSFKFSHISMLLWAGLLHEDENLALEDVEKMITLADLPLIGNKICEAINEAAANLTDIFNGLPIKSKRIN